MLSVFVVVCVSVMCICNVMVLLVSSWKFDCFGCVVFGVVSVLCSGVVVLVDNVWEIG